MAPHARKARERRGRHPPSASARRRVLRVRETFLLTGTDEHGLKVQEAARRLGLTPQQMCDGIAGEFRNCFDSLTVGYDRFATALRIKPPCCSCLTLTASSSLAAMATARSFIRTTDADHLAAVSKFWSALEVRPSLPQPTARAAATHRPPCHHPPLPAPPRVVPKIAAALLVLESCDV